MPIPNLLGVGIISLFFCSVGWFRLFSGQHLCFQFVRWYFRFICIKLPPNKLKLPLLFSLFSHDQIGSASVTKGQGAGLPFFDSVQNGS
jgi:hypothetical protein